MDERIAGLINTFKLLCEEQADEKRELKQEVLWHIREAMFFAVTSSVIGKEKFLICKLVVSEFYHSLNRKGILHYNEVQEQIDIIYAKLRKHFGIEVIIV